MLKVAILEIKLYLCKLKNKCQKVYSTHKKSYRKVCCTHKNVTVKNVKYNMKVTPKM